MSRRGMTLVELMVGTALLVGGGGALLLGMQYALVHADYLTETQVAMNTVQGELEQLMATDFATLANPAGPFAAARAFGQCVPMGEDTNCDGVLQPAEDTDADGRLDALMPGGRMSIRIEESPTGSLNPSLLDIHVAACWTARGRRIGEDVNCNGILNLGEDVNLNGWLDSPAMATTRIAVDD